MEADVRPLLLDLFCGAGGASAGYWSAGFDILGVDHEPQPHYPFTFVQCDVFKFLADSLPSDVEAIHASPPCQLFTQASHIRGAGKHVNLIPETRTWLRALGLPYVIENVPGAPLIRPDMICGRALGLGVKRHRLFECTIRLETPPCPPGHPGEWYSVFGRSVRARGASIHDQGPIIGIDVGRRAMGITWMNRAELSQAVPPAYTELIGHQLMKTLSTSAAPGGSLTSSQENLPTPDASESAY